MTAPPTTVHRFGRFEVHRVERSLLIDGQPAAIGSRAFDLLLALIDQPDRLLTKSDLLDRVWPGLVVEENNLQTQVSSLRKLLGAEAIATIPGRGYRFALVPDPAAAAPQRDTAPSPRGAMADCLPLLPAALGALLGRDDDLRALAALLPAQRLVTLLGAGGIGKSALALATAHAARRTFADGVVWVELAPIGDAALVPGAIAQALQLALSTPPAAALAALLHHLASQRLLLVLDNAEHLADATASLAAAVLAAAPGVHLLVTSQAPLRLDAEHLFRLDPLAVPTAAQPISAELALASGAVALFAQQARAANRHFLLDDRNAQTVVDLCRQLDGLPLAIKLAAARLPLLGLQGLAARLGERLVQQAGVAPGHPAETPQAEPTADRLQWLAGGGRSVPARHQTLRAALDWSHGLLTPTEQLVFRRLGVFVGGFALEAAVAVAAGVTVAGGCARLDDWTVVDALSSLVDRSLVERSAAPDAPAPDGVDPEEPPARYRLPEVVREYALSRLSEAGEQAAAKQQHALAVATQMDALYEAYWHQADAPWLAAAAPELGNLRAALRWSTRHAPTLAVRLVGAASFVYLLLGLAAEGRAAWLELWPAVQSHAAGAPGEAVAPAEAPMLARFWVEGSRLHWGVSGPLMRQFADRCLALARAGGDVRGEYLGLRCAAGSASTGPDEAARLLATMAGIEQPDWPPRLRAQRLQAAVEVAKAQGRLADARDGLERLHLLAAGAGLDNVLDAVGAGLAEVHLALGQTAQAIDRARALLVRPQRPLSGNYGLQVRATLGAALLAEGDPVRARGALAEFSAQSRSRDWEWFGLYSDLFTLLAVTERRWEAAARLLGFADAQQALGGTRALHAARARVQAGQSLQAALDARTLQRLAAEGAALTAAEVCLLALPDAA